MKKIIVLGFLIAAIGSAQDLRFEVASVRRADPKGGFGQGWTCTPARCTAGGMPLAALAMRAYDTKDQYQLEWASPWMASDRYDVETTVPKGATAEQIRVMMQRLLAERFGLVVHRENRQIPGFRLVVAKEGAKLKKSVDAPVDGSGASGPTIVRANGIPLFSASAKSGVLMTIASETIRSRHENMSWLVHQLVSAAHAPVIDGTSVEGEYDYDLTFVPEAAPHLNWNVIIASPPGPPNPPAVRVAAATAPAPDGPTRFSAIKQQLGLQLEPVKVPVEVVVLDKANREPTEN